MKKLLTLLVLLTASTAFAGIRIDISHKLTSVTENTVINGMDQHTSDGVIFITESLHLENGARLLIRNACLVVLGNITGAGTIDIDESSTITLEGSKKGKIKFTNQLLADSICQQNTGIDNFQDIKELPIGLNYSLYTLDGRLLDKGQIDEYLYGYIDTKTYLIKVEGFKLKEIIFKG